MVPEKSALEQMESNVSLVEEVPVPSTPSDPQFDEQRVVQQGIEDEILPPTQEIASETLMPPQDAPESLATSEGVPTPIETQDISAFSESH